MMAQQGKKVLLIGCDPKSDTTSLLFGGRACPTIIETSTKKKLAGDQVAIGDVCFKRDGVFAMELGGPEVGRGCGGRGIIHGFELLEKLGFHEWGFDYVLLDFLGDVVCGGFGLPIARDMCQKVIVVGSNDLQSLYVANNVCSAVEYFRKLGGNVGVGGLVINKDDGTGEAQAFAAAVGIPVLASIPADEDIRRKSANYEIIGRPESRWGSLFDELATNVAEAEPNRPKPLTQDQLLGLFKGEAVGRDVVARARDDGRHVRRARRCRSRRSKSSTTRCEGAMSLRDRQPLQGLQRKLVACALALEAAVGDRRARADEATASAAIPARLVMREAAEAAGMSETLERYAHDYPVGPHDQPQSMCPAFGALRVGLRMRRTASVLSGSACCVYGLTFTSHFYGARRTVGYVPFNSETLVTGKLFEDIREAVFKLADPDKYDAIVVINLCVPTASGVPLRLLPKEINGVRIIGIDVPGFGVPTHAEAKDVLAGAMLNFARHEAEQGPVQAPRGQRVGKADRDAARRNVPGRSGADRRACSSLLGLAAGPVVPTREWRELYGALDCAAVAAIHPFYTACVREFEAARPPDRRLGAGRSSTAPRPGSKRSARPAASRAIAGRRGEEQAAAGDQGAPCRRRRSAAASRCPATKARSCSSAGCSSRAAPTCAMSAPPARARASPRPTATGWRRRASRSISAPRSSRISRRSPSSSRISRSARRRSCRRRRNVRSPRSISPI